MQSIERFANANGRRYTVIVQENLFGSLEIIRIWGAASSARGGFKVEPVASALDCQKRLAGIRAVRRRRGYLVVSEDAGAKATTLDGLDH